MFTKFEIVNKFLPNLANSFRDECLEIWLRNYPLHIMYVCTLLRKVMTDKL